MEELAIFKRCIKEVSKDVLLDMIKNVLKKYLLNVSKRVLKREGNCMRRFRIIGVIRSLPEEF